MIPLCTASRRFIGSVRASAMSAGLSITIDPLRETPWESATFSGHRHEVSGEAAASPMLDEWLAGLPECDLPMPNQIAADVLVGDIRLAGGTTRFTIEALTIES